MGTQGDMPYTIEKEPDGQWCIYDKATGKKIPDGEFSDRRSAMNKVRELLKNPPKKDKESKKEDAADGEEED
jgi:hypothetical protein